MGSAEHQLNMQQNICQISWSNSTIKEKKLVITS